MKDLAPLRFFLPRKVVVKNDVKNVHEIIFYLRNQYLPHNEERGTFIEAIPSQEDRLSFEVISDYVKAVSKSIKEVENMSLKNKVLLGQRKYLDAIKICVGKICLVDLKIGCVESGITKQTIYNYRNLYKLMRITTKLLNCRVNMI